jgi:hypothetical protein
LKFDVFAFETPGHSRSSGFGLRAPGFRHA